MNDRQRIIQEIENIRNSRVIAYITSDRPGITSMIDPTDLREIFDHIKDIPRNTKIDLFIYSRGGNSVTAWALANLMREHTKNFNVLVPYRAHSCATAIAIGSNEIIMGRMGELGPIDPTLSAIVENKKVDVSTEDLSSYIAFLKDKFQITFQKYTVQAFGKLADNVKPLLLGRAYRSYLKARDDAMKLLRLQMTDEKKIKKITNHLVEKLYAHDHIINRREAQEHIGLNVIFAEGDLENKMWDLHLKYEEMLKLKEPYSDSPTTGEDPRILPLTVVESKTMTSQKNVRLFIKEVNLPQQSTNALPIIINDKPALMFPNGQAVQIVTEGQTIVLNQKFYSKSEIVEWEQEMAAE